MRFPDPIPVSNAIKKIELDDGRIARVVEEHHASPKERYQMWKSMREAEREYRKERPASKGKYGPWKHFRMNCMFLATVLDPNCKACWYEVSEQ